MQGQGQGQKGLHMNGAGQLMLLPPHLIVWPTPPTLPLPHRCPWGMRSAAGVAIVVVVAVVANRRVILRLIDFKAISLKCYLGLLLTV